MSASLVTIGIPCFNAGHTIRRALAGAFGQDWPSTEIIVADDCSSDRSVDIVESVFATQSHARLIRHEVNAGPAATRNSILSAARGEFVAFMDDDDEALPCRVSEQVRRIELHEMVTGARLIVCYASGERLYPNGYRIDLPAIGSRGDEVPHGAAVAEYLLLNRRRPNWCYGVGTPACSLAARRAVFESVGGFDPAFRRAEDIDLAIRLALHGAHFVGTRGHLYRQHATSAPDKTPEKNLEAEEMLAVKHRDYLNSIDGYYYALHWPRLRFWHFKRRYDRFALELLGLIARHPVSVGRHLVSTGPRRLLHEHRLRRRKTI